MTVLGPRALALAMVLATTAAVAGGRDPGAADVLFRDGRALMKKGDFAAACPKLAESQRLDPAPGTAINLGDCVEKLGKLADALQAYRDALELLPTGDARVGPVKEQIAALEKRVPRLTTKLAPGAPEGTKVQRDDIELGPGSLGVALPVNPGEHWLVVTAPGRADRREEVRLVEGAHQTVVVEAGELTASDNPVVKGGGLDAQEGAKTTRTGSPARVPESDGKKTTGLVLGGLGLAALAFGGVAFYETDQYARQAKDAADRGDDTAKKDKYATAETWQTAGIVSLVVGGAAVVTGGALWLSADDGAASGSHREVRVACTASPNFGALLLEGKW